MANEYAVNKADLTSVADAIREKGGTSGKLSFPSGFTTAINGIKTGTELNFEVVGGTSQPSSPKENTIWINTSTAISGWIIGTPENPTENPANGTVVILTDGYSNLSFNVLKDGYLFVSPVWAYQFYSNTWNEVELKIYKEGSWLSYVPDNALYYYGNEVTKLTGGWMVANRDYNYSAGAYTKRSDSIELRTTGQGTAIRAYTNNRINLNGVDAIWFHVSDLVPPGNGGGNIIITEWYDAPDQWAAYTPISAEDGYQGIDVSSLNGEYFVSIEIYQNGSGSTGMIAFDEVLME